MLVFFHPKCSAMGKVSVANGRVRDEEFMLSYA